MKHTNKEVTASGWYGMEHHKEIHTIDFYRFINMETLCRLHPDIFKPEIWLSDNPPKITKPKKTALAKRK